MINVAILDDEELYLNTERQLTEAYFAERGLACRIEVYQDADWFLGGLQEEMFDLYILDVEMPKKTGLDVAREIRRRYPEPVIIFVTNYADYAIEAYEVNTYRYIPKAILEEKLPEAYTALLPEILEKEERYYVIEKKLDMEKVGYSDIFYLKKDGRYTVLVHRRGESRVRKSLTLVVEELNSPEFLYIDKGCVVNIRHIMGLKNHQVRMRDGTRLPVGAPRLQQVHQAIAEYWR